MFGHSFSRWQCISAIALAILITSWLPTSRANGLPRAYEPRSGKAAMEAAAKSGKPIVIYFTQQNCIWCERVEGLLNKSELQPKLAESYHFVSVDIGLANKQSWNATLTKMLAVKGTPAFAAIRPNGDVLCMVYGMIEDEVELARLHENIQALNKGAKPTAIYKDGLPSCREQNSERDEFVSSVPAPTK